MLQTNWMLFAAVSSKLSPPSGSTLSVKAVRKPPLRHETLGPQLPHLFERGMSWEKDKVLWLNSYPPDADSMTVSWVAFSLPQ